MKRRKSFLGELFTLAALMTGTLAAPFQMIAQTTTTVITLSTTDLAYSDVTQLVYASNTNTATLMPINAATGTVGTAISIPSLSGRLCAGDGGSYIFAALNGATNHICQFDTSAQTVVNAWTLGGTYVDDMAPVLGSPAAVAVSQKILNRSPRFAGVVVYDNGVARSNIFSPFLGSNVIDPSRTNKIYGFNNESSPAGVQILQTDASGIKQVGGWGNPAAFGADISWRAGWLFMTTGQIFDPDRGIQFGSFANTPVSDDAASGRYYLVSPGAILAYDQNTLLPAEGAALTGVTGAAGSLIRCGTNGFAMRMSTTKIALIHTSFISSGASADVRLSVAPPSLPVATGSNLTYTLTISNSGPGTAQNLVLTQTLPANATFVSVTSSTGSNAPTSGGLVSTPMVIPAGGTATVTVNLKTLKAGLLASVACITSDSIDPNLSNNVVRLNFPVGGAPARNSVTEMSLPTTDIAWEPVSGRIFASMPNANWLLGNNIAALDPTTGNFDALIPTPIEPAKLAVSDDGQYLYCGINSDSSIQRVNIGSRTLDIKSPTGLSIVSDMAVLPGSPHTVAVTAQTTFAVYDDGVRRTNTVGPGQYNFPYFLAASDTNTVAYEGMTDGLHTIAIDPSGATISANLGLINTFDNHIRFAAGRLYTAGGRIIDPVAQTVITNLPYSGLVCPDAKGGKIFYLTVSGSTGTLYAVNITNFVTVGSVVVTNISGSAVSLIRWGLDGLAFQTTGSQVFLVRTIFADDSNNDGMADSWELANFGAIAVDPNGDPDHDGMSNLAEYVAGTDPNNASSALRITSAKWQNGSMALNWLNGTNVTYYIQRSPDLGNAASWQDIYTNSPSVVNTNGFTDLTATNAVNYYRIRVRSND